MQWYYMQGELRVGPITEAELHELLRNGVIPRQTLVWSEGLVTWQTADKALAVPPLPTAFGTTPDAGSACRECGLLFPPDEMIRFGNASICASCKPAFLQKLKEGILPTGELPYAAFRTRLGAKLLDGILLWVVNTGIQVALLGGFMVQMEPQSPGFWRRYLLSVFLSLGTHAAYSILLHGRYGATLGKRAVKIRVVNADGTPITYGKATARYFAEMLSSLTLMVGYIIAAFDPERRALHDRICNTRVVSR